MAEEDGLIYVEGSYGPLHAEGVKGGVIDVTLTGRKIHVYLSSGGWLPKRISIDAERDIKSIEIVEENEVEDYLLGRNTASIAHSLGQGAFGIVGNVVIGAAATAIRKGTAKSRTCFESLVRLEIVDDNWLIVRVHPRSMEKLLKKSHLSIVRYEERLRRSRSLPESKQQAINTNRATQATSSRSQGLWAERFRDRPPSRQNTAYQSQGLWAERFIDRSHSGNDQSDSPDRVTTLKAEDPTGPSAPNRVDQNWASGFEEKWPINETRGIQDEAKSAPQSSSPARDELTVSSVERNIGIEVQTPAKDQSVEINRLVASPPTHDQIQPEMAEGQPSELPDSSESLEDTLIRLKRWNEQGLISEDEYDQLRKKQLGLAS